MAALQEGQTLWALSHAFSPPGNWLPLELEKSKPCICAHQAAFSSHHTEAMGLCMAGDSCSLDFLEEEINSEVIKP